MAAQCSCVKAESSHLGNIWRRPHTLFSTPNGTFVSDKESKIELKFTEFSKSKLIAWKFYVIPKKKLPYDVIIGCYFMRELQMDGLYSEDLVVWEGVRLPM